MDAQKVIEELGGAAKVAASLKPVSFSQTGKRRKAKRQGITVQAIYKWRRVPIDRCAEIAALSGGKYTPQQLRPDFPWPVAA